MAAPDRLSDEDLTYEGLKLRADAERRLGADPKDEFLPVEEWAVEEQADRDLYGAVQEIRRDELGKLLPGQSLNPAGRPKGTITLGTLLRRYLNQSIVDKDGRQLKRAHKFIESVVRNAEAGSPTAMKLIWDRMDGSLKQQIELAAVVQNVPAPEAEKDQLPASLRQGLDRVYGTVKATEEDKAKAIEVKSEPKE